MVDLPSPSRPASRPRWPRGNRSAHSQNRPWLDGCGVSLVPGMPVVTIAPDLVLAVVLPPLVYSAALESSYLSIRANLRPIAFLSVGLVLFTAAVVGAVTYAVIPGLPLTAALLLGAVVAPTS